MAAPAGRHERVYSKEERLLIDPFKTEYLEANSPAARKAIVQTKILQPLFEYWEKIGEKVPTDKMEQRSDVTILLHLLDIALTINLGSPGLGQE
jgi:hypothetical protein